MTSVARRLKLSTLPVSRIPPQLFGELRDPAADCKGQRRSVDRGEAKRIEGALDPLDRFAIAA